jgi:hypothetical protein
MSSSFARQRLVSVLCAASLVVIFAGALSACGSDAGTPAGGNSAAGSGPTATAEVDGNPAPAFSGVTLDGKTLTLDQFRGKPLFLIYMTST